MITPEQIREALEKLSPLYEELEEHVIREITRSLSEAMKNLEERGEGGQIGRQFPGSVRNEAVQALAFGMSTEKIFETLRDALQLGEEEAAGLMRSISETGLLQQDRALNEMGLNPVKEELYPQLQNFVESAVVQTRGEIRNLTRTRAIGFSIKKGNGTEFLNLQDYIHHELDYALTKVSAGLESYDQAVFYAVKNMSRSGLRVQYPSGHTDRIDVAVRRATLTGVNQMTRYQNDALAEEFGTDLFEVTAHEGARPSHKKWQGKVYTKQELADICGLGSVDGLMGANCRHNYHPFLPGQQRAWTDEELEHIDNPPFTWKGKTYTEYEATQKQRSLESKIRVLKRQIYAFEEAGNEEALNSAKFKKRRLMQEYNQFSKAAGLKTRPNRMRVVKDLGENEKFDVSLRYNSFGANDWISNKERSRKGVNRKATIDRTYIHSSDYHRKFEQLEKDSRLAHILARESVKMLEHRQGTDYEDLIFVDTISGKVMAQTQDDTYRAVKASKSMVKAIKETKENRFIAIHNHPGSSLPSLSDLVIAASRRYKYGLIACHDGRVIKYSFRKNSSNESMRLVDSVLNRANAIYQKSDFKTDEWKNLIEELKIFGLYLEVL